MKNKPESIEQRTAFEEYCKLGDDRSLEKVADIVKKNSLTIQRWSKRFNWVKRVNQVDIDNIDTVTIESLADQMDSKKRNLKLVDVMLKEAAVIDENGNIVSSKVKLKSMSDIRTALEVRDALLGKDNKGKGGNIGTEIQQAVFIIKKD